MRFFASLLFLLCTPALAQDWSWAVDGGAIGPDAGLGIAAGPDGSACVTGSFETSAVFGTTTLTSAGSRDIFVARLAPDGTYLWAQRLGGSTSDLGRGVAVDADGACYVTGQFSGTASFGSFTFTSTGFGSDLFVAKLGADGKVLWATAGGGDEIDIGYDLAIGTDGGVYLAGTFHSSNAVFGQDTLDSVGLGDAVLARLDASTGAFIWTRTFGSTQSEFLRGVAVGPDGTVTAGGVFSLTVTIGSETLTSLGTTDLVVVRYTADGDVVWASAAGGTNTDFVNAMDVDPEGRVAIAGTFSDSATFGDDTITSAGSLEAFTSLLNADGTFAWVQAIGGTGVDRGVGVAMDPRGSVFVTGLFSEMAQVGPDVRTAVGREDAYVAAFDVDGDPLWSAQVGGTNVDEGNGIAVSPDGGVLVTGSYIASATAGPFTLSSIDENAFVGRLGGAAVYAEALPQDVSLMLSLAPNPARQSITVSISARDGAARVELVDALGRRVRLLADGPLPSAIPLDVSDLAPGLYLVRATTERGVVARPVVVAR